MALSAFSDKAHRPSDEDLKGSLRGAHAAWLRLREEVSTRIPDLTELWAFASKSTGWGLRLRRGDRVILYMTPCAGHFLASFVLGEKAVAEANAAKLPRPLLRAIASAPRYAEGRGVRFEVRAVSQVAALAELAAIKHGSASR